DFKRRTADDGRQHPGTPAQPLPVLVDRRRSRAARHLHPPACPRPGRLGGGPDPRPGRRGQPSGPAVHRQDGLLRRAPPHAHVRHHPHRRKL
ncbi:MAG: hypothetical protein AVDCRST_MAG83-81, partial [uncultured Arthrobacter sp.]